MICGKNLSHTYEISRVSKKMLNNEFLQCCFWSKLINGTNFIGNCALFPFTSFFEPMQISEVVSLFSEKLVAN